MGTTFNTTDSIPLSFMRIKTGAPVTGLSVTVKVINVRTGSTLLATTSLTEITTGVYEYVWTHGQTATTECIAEYVVADVTYAENFTIAANLDIIEAHVGRAT
jgi:energy-coupling factor transporter transmembrane protein EcfT